MVSLLVSGRSRRRLALLSVAALLSLGSAGIGASAASAAPVWKAVSVGSDHACAIRFVDGSLKCWGGNRYGQSTPPEGAFSAVAAGGLYTCAIRGFFRGEITGRLICWGKNRYGEATPEPSFGTFFALSDGEVHTCGIREQERRPVSAGTITCWGIDADISRPPEGKFTALSAGSTHTCALREADSSIVCWGQNTYGESSPPPGSFAAVAAGNRHTCGIRKSDRSIVCWGNDAYGMLNAPDGSFSSISAGDDFTCAVRSGDHSIVCWGYDVWGQTKPPAGTFLPSSEGLSARGSGACAIREGYTAIVCWGLAPDPPAGAGPPSVSQGRATLTPRRGLVRIVAPGGNASVVLSWATDVGSGTEINATRGRLEVSAAVGTRGLRSLTVSGGVVRLTQIKRGGLQVRAIKGVVTVSDLFTHRTIRLRTGASYTAR